MPDTCQDCRFCEPDPEHPGACYCMAHPPERSDGLYAAHPRILNCGTKVACAEAKPKIPIP